MDELVAAADTLKASRARKRPLTSRRTFYEIATRYETTIIERRAVDTLEAAVAASKGDRSALEKAKAKIAVLDKHVAQLKPVLDTGEDALSERKTARAKAAQDLAGIADSAASSKPVSDKRELSKVREHAARVTATPAKYAYHVRVAAPLSTLTGSASTSPRIASASARTGTASARTGTAAKPIKKRTP